MGRRRIGRKSIPLALPIFVVIMLSLFAFTACPNLHNPLLDKIIELVRVKRYTVLFTISDKDTTDPLSGSALTAVDMNLKVAASVGSISDSYELALDEGIYNIYLSKAGYRVKGYAVNVNTDLVINARLKSLTAAAEYGTISGSVNKDGIPYTGSFNISAGIVKVNTITEVIGNLDGVFTSVTSACGDIVVAAYTKTGEEIDLVAYRKNLTLVNGTPLNVPVLNFDTTDLDEFDGLKPESGDLKVKLNQRFTLAEQASITGVSDYLVKVNLQTGDSITLESVKFDGIYDTYFTRKNAGSSGGSNNIAFDVGLPSITITPGASYYKVSFPAVSGASFYEAYVVETLPVAPNIPLQIADISNNGAIVIPKSAIDSDATAVDIYISAVKLIDYNQAQFLADTLSYDQYSYGETGEAVSDYAGKSLTELTGSTGAATNYRQTYGFNYLIMEE